MRACCRLFSEARRSSVTGCNFWPSVQGLLRWVKRIPPSLAACARARSEPPGKRASCRWRRFEGGQQRGSWPWEVAQRASARGWCRGVVARLLHTQGLPSDSFSSTDLPFLSHKQLLKKWRSSQDEFGWKRPLRPSPSPWCL